MPPGFRRIETPAMLRATGSSATVDSLADLPAPTQPTMAGFQVVGEIFQGWRCAWRRGWGMALASGNADAMTAPRRRRRQPAAASILDRHAEHLAAAEDGDLIGGARHRTPLSGQLAGHIKPESRKL